MIFSNDSMILHFVSFLQEAVNGNLSTVKEMPRVAG